MRIRPAEAGDLPVLRQIYFRSRTKHFLWADRTRYALEDFDVDTLGERVWVAEGRGQRAEGFVSVWVPEHFIHTLFVAPEVMGQGYGSALLRAGLAQIGRPARLKCATRNEAALRFYVSRAWRIVGEGIGAEGPYYELAFTGAIPTGGEREA